MLVKCFRKVKYVYINSYGSLPFFGCVRAFGHILAQDHQSRLGG